jgi:probable HAF family extracellular repeat protein
MQDLGTLGGTLSQAMGVSSDGSTVVGAAMNAAGAYRAFRWTQSGGMQNIGVLPGGNYSIAYGASADGSVIVGMSENASIYNHAFLWTAQTGMQDLNVVYSHLVANGSHLEFAYAVSPNGRYVVGHGYNIVTGRREAFLLDTVPEPTTMMFLSSGLVGIALKRRRQRARIVYRLQDT